MADESFITLPTQVTKPAPDGRHVQPPGSGPAGETCRTCSHLRRNEIGAPRGKYCGRLRGGAPVGLRDPACSEWGMRIMREGATAS